MRLSVLLLILSLPIAIAPASTVYQADERGLVIIPAETPSEVVNPDVSNDIRSSEATGQPETDTAVWTRVSDESAHGGSALRAPDEPHKQLINPELQDTIANYRLRFDAPGIYSLHIRARNSGEPDDKSSDSIWVSKQLDDAVPTEVMNIEPTGEYTWTTGPTYSVSQDQVGKVMTFRLGAREPLAHVDAIVLTAGRGYGHAALDDIIAGQPPKPTPTPFAITVTGEQVTGDFLVGSTDELHSALTRAVPGQKIVMKSGRWEDAVIEFDGTRTANGRGGTSDAPITLAAEIGGAVVLTGQSRLRIAGEHMVVDGLLFTEGSSDGDEVISFRTSSSNLASHCTLTNTAVINFNPPSPEIDYKWVNVYGLNNTVSNCWFSGMNHKGVTLTVWLADDAPANNTLIENCYFGDRAPGSGNGYETIRIGTSTRSMQPSNAIVRNNLFERCDGEIEVISNKSVGNRYVGNTFRESAGMLTIRHGTHCHVEGNFFFGGGKPDSGGVRLIGPGHVVVNNYFEDLAGELFRGALVLMNGVPDSPLNRYLRTEDCLIAHNTFVNNAESLVFGVESSGGDTVLAPRRITLANNAILTDGANVLHVVNMPEESVWKGNLFDGGPLGADPGEGFEQASLQFVHDAHGIARPLAGSPMLNAAQPLGVHYDIDIDGQARPVQGADAGADEASDAPVTRRPLTQVDVGPHWMRVALRDASETTPQ